MSLKSGPTFFTIALLLMCGLCYAYFVQYYYGVEPCSMCYTQRYLYAIAIGCCLFSALLVKYFRGIKYLALLSVGLCCAFSFYHVGVEQKWWEGPKTCKSNEPSLNIGNMSDEEALKQLQSHLEKKNFVPCDKITWRVFNIPATVLDTLFLLFLFLINLIACMSCQQKAYRQLFRK
jgi:disulfide bond formation protein DsbB